MWSFNPAMKPSSYRRRLQTRAGGAYAPRRHYGGKRQTTTSGAEPGQTRKYHECCRAGTNWCLCRPCEHRRVPPLDAGSATPPSRRFLSCIKALAHGFAQTTDRAAGGRRPDRRGALLPGLATYAAFAASGRIAKVLGRTGINVMTRLMGLILAAMAVDLLADSLVKLFPILASPTLR